MAVSLSCVRSTPVIIHMISLLKCSIMTEAQTASSALKVSSPRSMNMTDCWRSTHLVLITAADVNYLHAAYTSAAVGITVASFVVTSACPPVTETPSLWTKPAHNSAAIRSY